MNLKPIEQSDFVKELTTMVPNILLEYDEPNRSALILDVVLYLELHLNCILRPMEVTYRTCKNSIILPLWPIRQVTNIVDKSGTEQKFSIEGNKLTINSSGDPSMKEFIITYQVGYAITVLQNTIPIMILMSNITDSFTKKINYGKDIEKVLQQLGEIYGKGDA